MLNQIPTEKHFNNLIQFRQAIYEHGLTKRKDAQFELLDSLVLSGPIRSFPELSLSPAFRRRWPSAYAAIEDGGQDNDWLPDSIGVQPATHPGGATVCSGWLRVAQTKSPDSA
jgi:hypothetical protein